MPKVPFSRERKEMGKTETTKKVPPSKAAAKMPGRATRALEKAAKEKAARKAA